MGILGFLGIFNGYTMRVCLSLVITQMVNHTKTTIEHDDPDACPTEDMLSNTTTTKTAQYNPHAIFDWDEATQGFVLSGFYYGYATTQLLGGFLSDRFGAKWILGCGLLSTALFNFLIPTVTRWGGSNWLFALCVIQGIGEYKKLKEIEKHTSQINELKESVKRLENERQEDKKRIAELETRLQRAEGEARDCSVEIHGVPAADGQDLYQLVQNLSEEVGVPVERADLSHCSRLRVINVATAGKPRAHQPIIVRFVHKYKRDMFLKNARDRKDNPLTTEALKLQGNPTTIYVNEHLSSAQKSLLFKVKEHFKSKLKYSYVWVQDNKIMIRKDMNAPFKSIRNEADFIKLSKIA